MYVFMYGLMYVCLYVCMYVCGSRFFLKCGELFKVLLECFPIENATSLSLFSAAAGPCLRRHPSRLRRRLR